jgi:RHS repeat-associated protein
MDSGLGDRAPTASSVTFNHTYNKANQRIGQTAADNSWFNYPAATPGTVSYSADALNRYTAVGAVSPTYDANSNLTFDGTFSFGYDAENRLTSASGAGNTASYTYDAQGRRRTKTVNGTTTVFVTDAGNREVLEYDGASGAIQRWYGLGSNDVVNQTNVVAGTRAVLIPDIQGSVIGSLDSGSGTLSKIGYLPYGKSVGGTAPFGYTAQRIDPETNGLYYYRGRHYSPAWGRFLQIDPIGFSGGSNLYVYVGNDPLNLVDPFGHVGLASAGDVNPAFYQGISANAQTALGAALQACAAACDPGVQMSIGDPLGALAFRGLAAFARAGVSAEEAVPVIEVSASRFGQAAEHISDAQAAGRPSILTIDRLGADANRTAATGGLAKVPGMQLDEYPPAMFSEGGAGASVRAINPSDNMSAGSYIGNCCRPLPNGAQVQIKVVP